MRKAMNAEKIEKKRCHRIGAALLFCAISMLLGTTLQAQTAAVLGSQQQAFERQAVTLFGKLSPAEQRAIRGATTGDVVWCGEKSDEDDPSNDPLSAEHWSPARNIRAGLVEWMITDPAPATYVHPAGVRLGGAKVTGRLDLENRSLRCALMMVRCWIPDGIDLYGAQAPSLNLRGSRMDFIDGRGMTVRGDVLLRGGVKTTVAQFTRAQIQGDLIFGGLFDRGVTAQTVEVKGDLLFEEDFVTHGNVDLTSARIGGNLGFYNASFAGHDENGVQAWRASVGGAFYWIGIKLARNTMLNLSDAKVAILQDDATSWPAAGNLILDGFEYGQIEGPSDVQSRLEWLGRQPHVYWPQPFLELAKTMRAAGQESDATDVLIAREDELRHLGGLSQAQKIWKFILKITIGYGYRPLLSLIWIVPFLIVGALLFGWGYRAGVVTPTDPEVHAEFVKSGKLPAAYQPFHPLVYSMDTFFPLVELHQEQFWLPCPNKGQSVRMFPFGWRFNLGSFLRMYLWIQILAGWIISTLLAAGLSGLIRTD
ncbi:MAG TPA: hypothetical protein VGI47_11130 [Candidatus Binataceae bacterium]